MCKGASSSSELQISNAERNPNKRAISAVRVSLGSTTAWKLLFQFEGHTSLTSSSTVALFGTCPIFSC